MDNKRAATPNETERILTSRVPVLIWVAIIYSEVMIFQLLSEPMLLRSILFTVAMAAHSCLYWFSLRLVSYGPWLYWFGHRFVRYGPWLYFVLQGAIIFLSSYLLPAGFPIVLVCLIPVLIGQGVGVYYQPLKVTMLFLALYLVFCAVVIWFHNGEQIGVLMPVLIMLIVVVVAYALLFYQQVHARVRTQTFLRELEIAHQKVEELTLANERQRMARDLHDTLAQGLAGLIMQLEAIDAHMTKGGAKRAHEIVQQSMSQARRSLSEARRAIDDLRSKSAAEVDFAEAVREEAQRFTMATGIPVDLELDVKTSLSTLVTEHAKHIVRECLTNVAKHAHAKIVYIRIMNMEQMLRMQIRDNGKGFNTQTIGRKAGHYGLIGIQERVRLLGGGINIQSSAREGTSIEIEVPLAKEARYEI